VQHSCQRLPVVSNHQHSPPPNGTLPALLRQVRRGVRRSQCSVFGGWWLSQAPVNHSSPDLQGQFRSLGNHGSIIPGILQPQHCATHTYCLVCWHRRLLLPCVTPSPVVPCCPNTPACPDRLCSHTQHHPHPIIIITDDHALSETPRVACRTAAAAAAARHTPHAYLSLQDSSSSSSTPHATRHTRTYPCSTALLAAAAVGSRCRCCAITAVPAHSLTRPRLHPS
jgi:hypothetical protein